MTVKYALETEVNTTGKGTGLEDVNGTVDRNLGNVVTEAIKESRRGFKTTSLTISGTDISLKIPGAPEYTGITTISVSYQEPMEVDLTGRIAEKQGRVEYLEIADARVAVTAYRTDKADAAISTALKVIAAAEEARKRDPEITLWQGTVRTVLNQVNGIPVIYVGKGEITYEKCSTHEKTRNKKPANNTAITLDDIALMHGNPDLLCINSNEQEPSNIAVDTTSQTRVLRLLDARMEHQGNDIYVPGTCYILTSSMASMLLGKDIESYGVGVVIASGIDPKKTPKIRGLEVGYELNGVYHGKNRLGILTPPLTIWAKEMEFTFESHEFALIGDGKGQARRYKDGIITLEDAVFYIQAPLPPLPVREKRLKRAIIGYTTGFLTGSAFATIGTGICTLVLIGYLGDNFPHTDDNIISQIYSCLTYKIILGIDAAVIVAGGLLGALKTENRKPQVLQEDWFFLNGAFYGKVKDHRYTCITDIL